MREPADKAACMQPLSELLRVCLLVAARNAHEIESVYHSNRIKNGYG